MGDLRNNGHQVEVLFLEARDEVLIRRYSESRRKHPMATEGTVLQGIQAERDLLQHLRHEASRIVDTSDLNVHELRSMVQVAYQSEERPERMHVFVGSFGFKYGVPTHTDLVFDVRFLPQPSFRRLASPPNGSASRGGSVCAGDDIWRVIYAALEDVSCRVAAALRARG